LISFLIYYFFYLIFFLYKVYREMKDVKNLDLFLFPIIQVMKEKFLKYWEEIPTVTIITSYLHPSFKKKYTVLMLQRYKNNLHLPYTEEKARMSSILEDIFNIYNYQQNINQVSSSGQNTRLHIEKLINLYYLLHSLLTHIMQVFF
jgi:hypothetical protein